MARPSKPWFRSQTQSWFATVNRQKVPLGVVGRKNEAAAWAAFAQLRSGSPPPAAAPTPTPTPAPAPAPTPVTVAEVISAFLSDAEDRVQPETLEVYRFFLLAFSARYGTLPVDRLTCPLAEAYSRKREWSASTRSTFLSVLVRAFRFGERSRTIDRSPLTDLKRPPVAGRTEEVLLTADEHRRLCAAAPKPFRLFLWFVWLTGCRPNEAAQVAAADVDWDAAAVTIRKHKTAKKGKRRVLYLSPKALALLKALAKNRPTGPLLRNRIGAKWTKATWGAAMRTARTKAGLSEKKVVYGLRHSYATDALAAGVPDSQVAELLGHASPQMLHRFYSHLYTKSKVLSEAAKKVR